MLPSQDSNLGKRIQSPSCYHYTTRQCDFKVIIGHYSGQQNFPCVLMLSDFVTPNCFAKMSPYEREGDIGQKGTEQVNSLE